MKHVLAIILFFSFAPASAQLTFGATGIVNDFDVYQFMNVNFSIGSEINLGFVKRGKHKRIDVLPSISWKKATRSMKRPNRIQIGGFTESIGTLNLQVRAFPFDLNGENKITVVKRGNPFLKPALFLFAQSGLSMIQQRYDLEASTTLFGTTILPTNKTFTDQTIRVGFGIGLEFGIIERLSISFSAGIFAYRDFPDDFLGELITDCGLGCFTSIPVDFPEMRFKNYIQNQNIITLTYEFGK